MLGALANLVAPLLVRMNIYYFIAIRVFQGMLGGLALPTMHPMIAAWTPKCERSRVATFIYSGCELGTVITLPIAGYLCYVDMLGGSPSAYYLFGGLGVIWFGLWSLLIS